MVLTQSLIILIIIFIIAYASSSQPSSAIKKCLISLLIVSCVRLVSVYFILSG
jgi:uncharacterized membrane protein